jgi:hypothetical protein
VRSYRRVPYADVHTMRLPGTALRFSRSPLILQALQTTVQHLAMGVPAHRLSNEPWLLSQAHCAHAHGALRVATYELAQSSLVHPHAPR